jgi:hypothetical protein
VGLGEVNSERKAGEPHYFEQIAETLLVFLSDL